jgi:hypothetical protein
MKRAIAAIVLVLAWSAGIASADTVNIAPGGDIQAAIDGASGARTIVLQTGTHTVSSTVNVNKPDITIQGEGPGNTRVQVSGTGYRFYITATGVIIEGLTLQKTDKTGLQNIIYVGANNTTIRNNVIYGQFVVGDGEVSRALEVAYGTSGLTIEGNEIYALRQPAYMNGSLASPTTGNITNNYVHQTKGWVIAGANMTFSGNTWGSGANGNVVDIAILSMTDPSYYTNIPAISTANNGAVIEDQRAAPPTLSVVFVDPAAAAGGDGTPMKPYQTITPAIPRVAAGGTIFVAAGTYNERLVIGKSLTMHGAQYGVDPTPTGARTNAAAESVIDTTGLPVTNPNVAIDISSGVSNVTLDGFTVLGSLTSHYADEAVIRAWNDHITISSNVLDGFYAVLFKGGNYLTAERNRITSNKVGLTVQPNPATNVTITGNTTRPSTGPASDAAAIYLTGVTTATISGNTATGFTSSNGLGGSNLTTMLVAGNDFSGNKNGINIWGSTTFITIDGNTLSGNSGNGITLKGQDLAITNNTITGNGDVGIKIDKHTLTTERVAIHHNTISGNTNYNLQVTAAVLETVNASENYWGTLVGSEIAAKVSGLVKVYPWCNSDFSNCTYTWPVHNTTQGTAYPTIQAALNAANPGDEIQVDAGTYAENITVSQSVVINGAGAGLTKVIPATSAPGGDGGPSLGGSQVFVIQAHDVTISNLTVDGNNPGLSSGVERNSVDIDARNGIIEGDGGPWNNLVVHHCTVKNIYLRGIYARSSGSGFHIHHNTVQNVDGGPSSIAIFNFGGAGIIEDNNVSLASDAISANWSRGTQFLHNTVTQSGSGVHTDNNGGFGGVADLIHHNHVSDLSTNGYGVWVFFPYVNTVVEENSITDADIGLFAWGGSGGTATFSSNVVSSPSRPGSIGAYVTAGPDYWGSYQSNVAANFSANVVSNVAYGFIIETDEVTPFFNATVASSGDSWTGTVADIGVAGLGTFSTTGLLGDTVYVFNPGKIQVGVDVAAPGVGVVTVAPGLYAQYVVVNKSISLLGPTAGVSKVGYTVPANYAWNTAVEAVISNPTPQPTGDVQVVDIAADDVVFKGFIVESLNAPAASANDQLLRIDAGSNGVRDGVVVQNNIIGPNTNVSGQTGTNGRMGLYFASPSYPPGGGITNTLVSGNKIFDCRGNGNNVFVWGSAASYGSPSRANYSGTVIENNEIYGSHRSGIEIAGGVSGLTIRNNSIFGNSSQVNGAAYDANLKWGNGIAVIRMGGDKTRCDAMGVDGLTITGNLFRDNEKNGIYFGPIASNCSMTGNSFFDNGQDGIRVDLTEAYYGGSATPCYDQTGSIVASGNRIYNNGAGASVIGTPTNMFFLDAINNFWGSGEGPYNEIGTFEVSPANCGTVSVNDMQNVLPAGELGNAVSENVAYCPWSRTLAQLSLESNATCYTTSGAEVVVNIVLDEEVAIDEILGGQFFLAYDKLALDFVSANPAPAVFVQEVYESVNETAGTIDYAVGVLQGSPGHSGTGPILMATIRFHAIDQACNEPDLVTFRPTSPYITCLTMKLGGTAIPVKPQVLNNLNAISLDWTLPTFTCPTGGDLGCNPTPPTCESVKSLVTDLDDNCLATPPTLNCSTAGMQGTGCHKSQTFTLTATDACGNTTATPCVVAYTWTEDITPPVLSSLPSGGDLGCNPTLPICATNVTATDACDGTVAVACTPGTMTSTGCLRSQMFTYSADDLCGNHASADVIYTWKVDTTPPVVAAPADITVNADAGLCTAIVNPGTATATDNCTATLAVTGTRDDSLPLTDPYPSGDTTITWSTSDECGNPGSDTQTITVLGYNDFKVSLELQGLNTAVTRCIAFTFSNCPGGTPAMSFTQDIPFGADGKATNVLIANKLTCGSYNCVTAEDTLHTLLVKVIPSISGVQYVANFTGSDMLKTGDYYNDNLVDIVDFGVLIAQWGANYDGNGDHVTDGHTPCGVFMANMHADANGDGVLDLSDYTWISTNFLALGDNECCISPFASPQPRRSITVAELLRLGVRRAGRADLNRDGVVDMTDVQLFLNGTIPNDGGYGDIDPTPVPSGKGPKLSTSGNQAPVSGLQPKPR